MSTDETARRRNQTLEIAHTWRGQVLEVSTFSTDGPVTVGPDGANDFQVGERTVPRERTELLATIDGRRVLLFSTEMSGTDWTAEGARSLRELVRSGVAREIPTYADTYAVELASGRGARVEFGDNRFLIQFAEMPEASTGFQNVDSEPLPYQGISAAGHLLFLFLCVSLPGEATTLDMDASEVESRFIEMTLRPEKKAEEASERQPSNDESSDEQAARAAKSPEGNEGKAGREEETSEDGSMGVEGSSDRDEISAPAERNERVARNAGVVEVFREQSSNGWGKSSKVVGSSARTALGQMAETETAPGSGAGGLGVEGAGRSGPGEEGLLTTGELDCEGFCGPGEGGPGIPEGEGPPGGPPGEHETATPQPVPGDPEVGPALPKDVVRRVVRQHRREVRYCYEKALETEPNLEGQVEVDFTISSNGEVISAVARNSSTDHAGLEQCLQNKVTHWNFPEPDGGRVVEVSYPFRFSRGN